MFVHLHTHTEYSLLDGMGKIKDYVAKAKEYGMSALAITDHGVGYGLVEFYTECNTQGIKPILGCEFYEATGSRFEKSIEAERKYFHLILLVKNETGYKNLCKLISRSNTEGFYYKPRIDFELLEKYHEGLICLSACVAGKIPQLIISGAKKEVVEKEIMKYKNLFGDDFYLEIQNHGLSDEILVAQELYKYSRQLGVKLVATNDCHYVQSEDAEAHDWLLCLQTKKKVDDVDRMRYEGDYSLKSEEEMRKLYPSMQEAFDNTIEIAEKCNFDFKFAHGAADYRMPKVEIPDKYNKDYFKYLSDLAKEGFNKKYPAGHKYREEAKERIGYELSVIKNMGFAEYFLDTRKTIFWARTHGILVGPGRGSGAGSVMNYCLGITDIEPLKYGLLFERFLNPERISMPDIDVDYSEAHKKEVLAFEAESNGRDNFAKIQTFGAMLAKGVIKDCLRVADYPISMGSDLSKMIGDAATLKEAYDLNPDIPEYIKTNNLEKVWDIACKLEGTKKSAGTHACGHIPTPVPCEDLFPCSIDKETGYLICQYNMTEAEHLGNLKKDLLMLRNLEVITVAAKEIRRRTGEKTPLWNEKVLTDKKTFELISEGRTAGVFQIESEGMRSFMKKLKPDCFEDIIAGVSLYRPGPMDYIPDYIKNKYNPESITYLTPELESILAPTYGVIVYQEQVMQIVQKLAGFSMGRADVVRKAMGKKKMDIMMEERKHFIYGSEELNIPGCVKNGIAEEVAGKIYDQMVDFAKYAFNKSHAAAYAAITMQTAYLKANYPLEFMTGLLSSVIDNTEKLVPYLSECKKMGIQILPPDLNNSGVVFETEGNSIRYGLLAIKGVGEDDLKKVVSDRKENGPYRDITDILERTSTDSVLGKGFFFPLIKAGALDFMQLSRKSLLENIENIIKNYKKDSKSQTIGQMSLFEFMGIEVKKDNIVDNGEYSESEILSLEKEAVGTYISGHPLEKYRGVIKNIVSDTAVSIKEKAAAKEGESVKVAGMILSMKRIFTKKDQKAMAFVKIEDLTGEIELVIFPKTYEKYKHLLTEDVKIFVTGDISVDEDKSSLLVQEITLLDNKKESLWLRFENEAEKFLFLERNKEFLERNQGEGTIVYYVDETKNKEKIPKAINLESYDRFVELLGKNKVFLS